jgi:large subunit ribosomal protein L19
MIDKEILDKIKPGAMVSVQDKFGSFQGLVLGRKHGNEVGATFTVRATLAGVGVEKVYPINSPNILKVKILSSPKKIHRSKLYFLRSISKKKIRQKIGGMA